MTTIQEKLLKMLIDIDRVSREHNVEYAISGGTLLGAVREKGFIPWDDDIDIDVEIDKFEEFMDVMEKYLPSNYGVIRYSKYKNTRFHYGQIVDTDVKVERSFTDNKKIPSGLSIDIFNVFMIRRKSNYLKWLLKYKWSRNYVDNRKIVNFLKIPLKIIPAGYLNRRIDKVIASTSEDGTHFSTTQAFQFQPTEYKISNKRVDVLFEGRTIMTYSDYEKYLECHFGKDYMTPDKGQKNHGIKLA